MSNYRIQLPTHTLDSAPTAAKPLLDAAQKQMGMIPNLYGDMANVPGVLSTYLHGYERFRKATDLTPAEQEIVLLTVSYENGCHYCMAAHSSLAANRSKVPTDALQALRSGSAIEHPKLGALSRFTKVLMDKRGRPSAEDVHIFFAAGYTERHILDVILAIGLKTISNYTARLFETEVDDPFTTWSWSAPECAACSAA